MNTCLLWRMIWLTSFFSKSSIETGPKNVKIEIKRATRRLLGTSSYIFKELLLFGRTLCLPSVGGARFWCMSRRLYSGKWRGSHFRWFLRNLSITSRDKQFQAWTCFKKLAWRRELYISFMSNMAASNLGPELHSFAHIISTHEGSCYSVRFVW